MIGRWTVAGCAVLLSACTTLAPPPEGEGIALRPARSEIHRFDLVGRVAVKSASASFSAQLDWRHDGDNSERIVLSSPLGQGLAQLDFDGGAARLRTARGEQFEAASLDDLSAQVFGARLPLSRLPLWVIGQVTDGVEHLAVDDRGRPESFDAAGWRVAYSSYEHAGPDALPSLIRLSRDELDVRLKIDRWNLTPQ
jgi:outer membrane lipoprotein LolB